jgi:hypothetical protein
VVDVRAEVAKLHRHSHSLTSELIGDSSGRQLVAAAVLGGQPDKGAEEPICLGAPELLKLG